MSALIHKTAEFKICPRQNPRPWDEIPLLFYLDLQSQTYSNLTLQANNRAQLLANALLFYDVRWNWHNDCIGYYAQTDDKINRSAFNQTQEPQ